MKDLDTNIFPIFSDLVQADEKERFLNQKAVSFWFTGLSGSGKSTLAIAAERFFFSKGYLVQMIDGDNIRSGINSNLGFSEADRKENIRRIAEISKLFNQCGIVTINCFVSPTIEIRTLAKSIIGSEKFVEVFVDTPLEICESRDVKGLYKKARKGEIKDFTGISSPFESPVKPEITIKTEGEKIEESVQELIVKMNPYIKL